MCGITGYISKESISNIQILDKMVNTLNHRGPDDKGSIIYNLNRKCVAFGHTRLSILDLSLAGHQPMEYKQYSIVFNGEIYNYKEIKKELELLNHKFISNSDTEVILHSFDEWGVDSVHKFIGMFVFSILDKQDELVYFFRDRVGVKPFYYYFKDNIFLFSSELKSFHKHPAFEKEIDNSSLKLYFDYGYIPAPNTIFHNCFKLKAGHFLKFDLNSHNFCINEYWNVDKFYFQPKIKIGYNDAKEEVHNLLKSAFNYRMVSDVPVGIFLSGGYDSTAVAGILQKDRIEKLKTFTIGFEEGNNEAHFAKEISNIFGTDHTEYYFNSKDVKDIIPDLPYFYDEPFFDNSSLPTIMVSKLAKNEVTVALSGDGGDEIFAGYVNYPSLDKKLKLINKIPNILKNPTSSFLEHTIGFIPKNKTILRHKIEGISKALNKNKLQQSETLYHQMNKLPSIYSKKLFKYKNEIYKSGFEGLSLNYHDEIEMAMAIDYRMYLSDDILTKVDRATMSVSLEGREPLLDHRIVEYVAQLPLAYKYDGKTTKKILKDIVHDYIPKKMMDRPKAGFSIPIYRWLRGDLKFLLDEYLSREALLESNIFNVDFVLQIIERFKMNKFDFEKLIWQLIIFQMWYKKWC